MTDNARGARAKTIHGRTGQEGGGEAEGGRALWSSPQVVPHKQLVVTTVVVKAMVVGGSGVGADLGLAIGALRHTLT